MSAGVLMGVATVETAVAASSNSALTAVSTAAGRAGARRLARSQTRARSRARPLPPLVGAGAMVRAGHACFASKGLHGLDDAIVVVATMTR